MSTSDTSIRQLQLGTQYMALGFGFPVLLMGMMGDILNIIVLYYNRNYKTNSSSFFMIAKSIFDWNAIILGLIGHILIQGFRENAITSERWCKFRIPLLYINSLCSSTCLCLQSIDSYISSSRNVNIRQISTIKRARFIVLIFLLIWICNESPYYFFTPVNIIPNWRCQTTNILYSQYKTYFTILTVSIIIPIIIISLFGYLTYTNLHILDIDDRHRLSALTKQTTKMVIYVISIVLFFQCPYGISQIYSISTTYLTKTLYRQT